jgi:hypothetical protein
MICDKEPNTDRERTILGSLQHVGTFSTHEVARIFIKSVSCLSEFNELCGKSTFPTILSNNVIDPELLLSSVDPQMISS